MKYEVVFESFTEKHFIKGFSKKYKSTWDFTFKLLHEEFEQIDFLFLKQSAEVIISFPGIKICKTEFKIAGTQVSRHTSGNRCIVAVYDDTQVVSVLLVYNKTDLPSTNETAEWKKLIKNNYPDLRKYI